MESSKKCGWESFLSGEMVLAREITDKTVRFGHDTEDLCEYLEVHFPGISKSLADTYITDVLVLVPKGTLPKFEEVVANVRNFGKGLTSQQTRDVVCMLYPQVNSDSKEWAKNCLIAMIEYGLENYINALRAAGDAECALTISDFHGFMSRREDPGNGLSTLLQVEAKKAELLAKALNSKVA